MVALLELWPRQAKPGNALDRLDLEGSIESIEFSGNLRGSLDDIRLILEEPPPPTVTAVVEANQVAIGR